MLQREKMLDEEINEEADKVKMTSEFVSTIKKLDSNLVDVGPLTNINHNLIQMDDGMEGDAMEFL